MAGLAILGIGEVCSSAAGQSLTPAQRALLTSAIERYVGLQLMGTGRVAIEILRVSGAWPAREDTVGWQIRAINRLQPGMVNSFEIRGSDPAHGPWTVSVAARVELFQQVVVATRDLRAGEVVDRSDVALEERSLTGLLGEPLRGEEEALGRRLRGSVKAGTILTRRFLEEVPLVRRGDLVRIVAAVGAVRVETEGRALESASLGESVLVRNAGSGKTVRGLVVARGEVLVRP